LPDDVVPAGFLGRGWAGLEDQPRVPADVKKLKGRDAWRNSAWAIYRVIYEIHDRILQVHRHHGRPPAGEFYR